MSRILEEVVEIDGILSPHGDEGYYFISEPFIVYAYRVDGDRDDSFWTWRKEDVRAVTHGEDGWKAVLRYGLVIDDKEDERLGHEFRYRVFTKTEI